MEQIEKVGKLVRPMVKINGPKATDGFDGCWPIVRSGTNSIH